jgi:sugar (pentulose or hexulose) kinase
MSSSPVVAILDVGKTNKKLFLFDESYRIVWENNQVLPETTDEDGEPCEDLDRLNRWIQEVMANAVKAGKFSIRAINFSAYGASFVHIDLRGKPVTPLYSYLKPYPEKLKKDLYDQYGGELIFSMITASPVLGSLNSGMQLYRIMKEKPKSFSQIVYSLHLPQYLSWLVTGKARSDITSIGCHTHLWNFQQNGYHEWVYREGIIDKLPPIESADTVFPVNNLETRLNLPSVNPDCVIGTGLHDSSAAIIPYLEIFREPFILISTGTWCISLNPFNTDPLTIAELQNDCLSYMTFRGGSMKASRLFAGYEHEQQVVKLAAWFQKEKDAYSRVDFNPETVSSLKKKNTGSDLHFSSTPVSASVFARRNLSGFENFEEAYHQLMMDIMEQQVRSTQLIMPGDSIKRIFVDGGFGRNAVYMQLLAAAFPLIEVYAAKIAQASAIGAAMAIHQHWNGLPLPDDLIELRRIRGLDD